MLYIHVPLMRVHPRQRGAEEQAHPALGEGTAEHRYPAGHSGVPHGQPHHRGISGGRSPCSATWREDCVIPNVTASTLYEVPLLLEQGGAVPGGLPQAGAAGGGAGHGPVAGHGGEDPRGTPPCDHCAGGEVHGIARCVSQRGGVPIPRRHAEGVHPVGGLRGHWWRRTWSRCWPGAAACWSLPAASGIGASRGMILAAQYAREHQVPYLGICLGMQIAVIEFARHVVGWADAHSAEFTAMTAHPVIDPDVGSGGRYRQRGRTMRLGKYPCRLAEGSGPEEVRHGGAISERHRHRLGFQQPLPLCGLEAAGLRLSGLSRTAAWWGVVEEPAHRWFVGAQFHPEFKSRPDRPHPLFRGFVQASLETAE